ncbi:hypothetical protein N9350_01030 [Gammaproteobacteria bacterium]|nr:hypothetical protein [Gammaproteobacteria bacterium]
MREETQKMAEGKDKIVERLAERMAQTNNIKPNHAVGEVYKPNIHDPYNQYRWQDEEANAPAWVWAMRVLGTLGFFVGIYCLTLLTFLF